MWAVLDHLNAALVAAVIAVIAVGVVIAQQQDGMAASSRAATAGALASTVEWIERDLDNLGAGGTGDAVVEVAWIGSTPSFTFVTGPDTSVTAPPRTVRYERADRGDGLFELRRYEVDPAGDRLTTRSPATLRALRVTVYDRDGDETTQPHLARAVAVHLTMAPPLGVGEPAEWQRRFSIHPRFR